MALVHVKYRVKISEEKFKKGVKKDVNEKEFDEEEKRKKEGGGDEGKKIDGEEGDGGRSCSVIKRDQSGY